MRPDPLKLTTPLLGGTALQAKIPLFSSISAVLVAFVSWIKEETNELGNSRFVVFQTTYLFSSCVCAVLKSPALST